jgi:hypothetical protein
VQRCIKCERLWKELSDAAMAYVRIYCEHERLIEVGGSNAHHLSQLAAAADIRKTARQALRDHEAGPGVVRWPCHQSSENVVSRTLVRGTAAS